ncbi:lipopolysaccharide biosynthesis protein [uncultured Draconibacterium sp.]|uniref:lipopolysaccharide biosynthesis protein n=1 Tax=uncultured Draconibacterium sp. TaxID=1573823 RepID=UPI00321761F3
MTSNLKQKTIGGLFWSFIDNFAKLGIQFIVGIILARILSPREFGLIGMLTIFIAISQTIVESGFSTALIRKRECSLADYSTVFYFNLLVSAALYIFLFFSSGLIGRFFEEPELENMLKVFGIILIINALGIIQQTIFSKEINFKVQTYVTLVASVGSGVLAITTALMGLGVWSLVILNLSRACLNTLFLWIWSVWRPIRIFSKESFFELFGFGSKLLISALIETIYQNVYYLIIGKYFSAMELGFYTRADQFRNLPSKNIMGVIQRVSYPVLSSIQDEKERLKSNYKKLIRSTMFITFVMMLGMAAIAKPMVIALVGEKWLPSVPYLQLLCFVGMFYPLQALNLNMLNVKGRSDLFLRLEIIKKIIAIPVILVGIFIGIKAMIIGMIINSVFAYGLNSFYSGKLIGYSTKQQIIDILPSFLFSSLMAIIVFMVGTFIPYSNWIILIAQLGLGALIVFIFGELLNFGDYQYLKRIVMEQWIQKRSS